MSEDTAREAKRRAMEIMVHYFNQAGVKMEYDNVLEISEMIGLIVDAAVEMSIEELKGAL